MFFDKFKNEGIQDICWQILKRGVLLIFVDILKWEVLVIFVEKF